MAYKVRRSCFVLQTEVTSPLGHVSLAGYIRHGRGLPFDRLRVFGRYALVYLLEGEGRFLSGNLPVMPCRAGDLLFVYPEIPHAYGPETGQIWSEFYIVFNGPIFDLWRHRGLLQPQQPIRHLPQIRRWLPELEAAAAPGYPATEEGMLRRVCRLQQFLGDIVPEAAPSTLPWLESAMDVLVNQPDRKPEEIAKSLDLSYETFRKEFTRRTGLPPARYRRHRFMEQARLLMAERNLSNKQIAETLGFYDEFHFSRRFRQITGQSTRDFRRSLE